MKNINELINKAKINKDGSMTFEGKELVREMLTGLAEQETFTITLTEEDLPPVSGDWIEGKWLPDLRVNTLTLDMVEKNGKIISNPHAAAQGRKSEVYLTAEELNVLDCLKGAEMTLRRRGPFGGELLDSMTYLQSFNLHYRFLFYMQWFRVNNREAFFVLLD